MWQVRLYDILSEAYIGPVIFESPSLIEAAKEARKADADPERVEELLWLPPPPSVDLPSDVNRVAFFRHHYQWSATG